MSFSDHPTGSRSVMGSDDCGKLTTIGDLGFKTYGTEFDIRSHRF